MTVRSGRYCLWAAGLTAVTLLVALGRGRAMASDASQAPLAATLMGVNAHTAATPGVIDQLHSAGS